MLQNLSLKNIYYLTPTLMAKFSQTNEILYSASSGVRQKNKIQMCQCLLSFLSRF